MNCVFCNNIGPQIWIKLYNCNHYHCGCIANYSYLDEYVINNCPICTNYEYKYDILNLNKDECILQHNYNHIIPSCSYCNKIDEEYYIINKFCCNHIFCIRCLIYPNYTKYYTIEKAKLYLSSNFLKIFNKCLQHTNNSDKCNICKEPFWINKIKNDIYRWQNYDDDISPYIYNIYKKYNLTYLYIDHDSMFIKLFKLINPINKKIYYYNDKKYNITYPLSKNILSLKYRDDIFNFINFNYCNILKFKKYNIFKLFKKNFNKDPNLNLIKECYFIYLINYFIITYKNLSLTEILIIFNNYDNKCFDYFYNKLEQNNNLYFNEYIEYKNNKYILKEFEIKQPEINKSDIKQFEIKQHEIKQSEINQSEIKEPDIKEPEIKQPEIKQPEIKQNDIKELEIEHISICKNRILTDGDRQQVWCKYIGKIFEIECPICNINIINCFNFECGHIVPKSKGGSDEIENLRAICNICNKRMGTNNMLEWVKLKYKNSKLT